MKICWNDINERPTFKEIINMFDNRELNDIKFDELDIKNNDFKFNDLDIINIKNNDNLNDNLNDNNLDDNFNEKEKLINEKEN
jgi:hypothetical protein